LPPQLERATNASKEGTGPGRSSRISPAKGAAARDQGQGAGSRRPRAGLPEPAASEARAWQISPVRGSSRAVVARQGRAGDTGISHAEDVAGALSRPARLATTGGARCRHGSSRVAKLAAARDLEQRMLLEWPRRRRAYEDEGERTGGENRTYESFSS
jgi:hypothetical protein